MMQGARGLNGTNKVGITEQGGRQVVNTFRGGQFIIEDKRKKKKSKKTAGGAGNVQDSADTTTTTTTTTITTTTSEVNKRKATMDDLKQGTQTLPSWAVVPKNATKFTDR
jgi:hypothetical protein